MPRAGELRCRPGCGCAQGWGRGPRGTGSSWPLLAQLLGGASGGGAVPVWSEELTGLGLVSPTLPGALKGELALPMPHSGSPG